MLANILNGHPFHGIEKNPLGIKSLPPDDKRFGIVYIPPQLPYILTMIPIANLIRGFT